MARVVVANAAGRNSDSFVPEKGRDEGRFRKPAPSWSPMPCCWRSRWSPGPTLLLWVWIVPVLTRPAFPARLSAGRACALPACRQHARKHPHDLHHRLVRFIAWNMPYHAEHHSYPTVPFHQLPRFHADRRRASAKHRTRLCPLSSQTRGRSATIALSVRLPRQTKAPSYLRHPIASLLKARASSDNKRHSGAFRQCSDTSRIANSHGRSDRRLLARHPRPGHRQEGPAERQARTAAALHRGDRHVRDAHRRRRHRRLSGGMAQGRSGAGRRRPRSRGREGARTTSTRSTTASGWSLWSRRAARKMSETVRQIQIQRSPRPLWSRRQRRNPTTSRPTCRRSGACSAPMRCGCGRCAIRACSNGSMPGSPTCSCSSIPCGRASATAASKAPVKFVEKRVKGFMFDCRMCGQCVLSSTGMSCPMNCPKQLRNGPCGGVRANGNCEVEPDMPCVWVKAWEGSQQHGQGRRHPRRAEAGRPVAARNLGLAAGHRASGRRARSRQAREPRHERTARQRDENPAGIHLPLDPLPGHSSRGRLERVLRRGEFAVTAELNPPDSADPEDVYDRARIFDGWVDAHQRRRCVGRQLPHVVGRHLRAADPHGLCADHADRLPRQEPHRHPGRRARRRRDGRRQHAVPDRRRRAGRRPAGRQAGVRPRLHVAARDHPHHARQRQVPVRPQADDAAAGVPRRRDQSVRAALRFPPASARQEDRRRRAVRAEPVLLRRADVPHLHGAASATSASPRNASSCAASGRWPRPRRRAGSAPTCRASTSPTPSSSGSKAPRTRRRKASSSASTSSTR